MRLRPFSLIGRPRTSSEISPLKTGDRPGKAPGRPAGRESHGETRRVKPSGVMSNIVFAETTETQ